MAIELWQADPTRSEITFRLRHLVLATIDGRARLTRAEMRIDPGHPDRSSIDAIIDARSIETGLPERDDHIRSAEFLDAAVHREIRFKSTSVVPAGEGRYVVTGILTLREVAREVSLEVETRGVASGSEGSPHVRFRAHATFDRQHFGLRWNQDLDRGGVVLGDKVEVNIGIEAAPAVPLGGTH